MKKLSVTVLALFLLSCGDNSVNVYDGSDDRSGTPANAVVLTLTSWQTNISECRPDPTIHFNVIAYRNGRAVSAESSGKLLDAEDISRSWSGSRKSLPILFSADADFLEVYAVVYDKELLFDKNISPGQYMEWNPIPYAGHTGTVTLGYGSSGKSAVRFDYEFITW